MEIRSPQTEREWEDYFDLRYRILRKPLNQPKGSERNEGDASGIHIALYDNGIVKAIARLDQQDAEVFQVRFVAVEKAEQGAGYGRKIMEATEQKAKELKGQKIILHARDYAVDFYLKLNYKLIEPSYKLFDVLQHFLMEKEFFKIEIISIDTKSLGEYQKIQLMHLWNKEYPGSLAHKSWEDFEQYLATLSYCKHYLLEENQSIFAWGFEFDRNDERWFALIIDKNQQGKRIGSLLLNYMKQFNKQLNGWVIDHGTAKMSDGTYYRSPLTFYIKNDFQLITHQRIDNEVISAVKIQWNS
jgi:GNAT superfamily N-acetyltransferase